jgi:hypothetical protein
MKKKSVYLLVMSLSVLFALFNNPVVAIESTDLDMELVDTNDDTDESQEERNPELEPRTYEPAQGINAIIDDEQSFSWIWYTGGGLLAAGVIVYFIRKKQGNVS